MINLLSFIGFIGFIFILGGVGKIELDPNSFGIGVSRIVIGFLVIIVVLLIGKRIENKRIEVLDYPDWERKLQKKKKKRLGLA